MIPGGADPGPRRLLAFETLTVIAVTVLPLLAASVVMSLAPPVVAYGSYDILRGIVHSLLGLLLVAYVLAQRGETPAAIGFRGGLRPILVSIPLTVLVYVAYAAAVVLLHDALMAEATLKRSRLAFMDGPAVLTLAYVVVGPVFEETVVRAYLMTRLSALGVSTAGTIVMSVALQCGYHGYQGPTTALAYAPVFLVYAIYFARRRDALAPTLSHVWVDLIAWMAAQMGMFGR